jgi:hypothetical protein
MIRQAPTAAPTAPMPRPPRNPPASAPTPSASGDKLHTATDTRLAILEETRSALRIRAERAEADLDTARAANQRLTEQSAAAAAYTDDHLHD